MPLSKIFHLSDIHIRNGDDKQSRFQEYLDVFRNLFESLEQRTKSLDKNDFIIVVTGDIFHHKNVIGNYGLSLYKAFIEGLTSIGKTIIFHGNHDRNQNEINQPSLIASTLDIPNLTILHETQSFVIDNIGFSYVSIDDTLDAHTTCGRVQHLPAFPRQKNTSHKIALFHGTFTHTGDNNTYPFEWIKDFDFALLGDIHTRQYGLYNKKTLWGYAGSLIQQNYGEDIIDHGYLIWDLESKAIEEVNVQNSIGYVNIKSEQIKYKNNYVPIEDLITHPNFPKKIDVKIQTCDVHNLLSLCSNHNVICNVINKVTLVNTDQTVSDNSIEMITPNISQDSLIDYFSKYLSQTQIKILSDITHTYDNILLNLERFPDDLHDDCRKKNKELSLLVNNLMKTNDVKNKRSPFLIKYLEWKNIYCYEGMNWINFENTMSSTFMVAGNNGTGKSAIYDILTLAIWGSLTLSKQNSLSAGIINHKHNSAVTIIDIEIDNEIYRIQRTYNIKNTILNKAHVTLYKNSTLYKKDNACNIEIQKLFGSMEEFLASSMITQNIDKNILKMDYKESTELIDKIYDIEYIYALYELLKSANKKYKDMKKTIEAKQEVYSRLLTDAKIKPVQDNISESELQKLLHMRDTLTKENNTLFIDLNDTNIPTILKTDYDALLKGLGNIDIDLDTAQATYNELKILLKDHNMQDIKKLSSKFTKPYVGNKPCDYHTIIEEDETLKQFSIPNDIDITDLQNEYIEVSKCLKLHNENKPVTMSKQPPTCLETYDKFYASLEDLQHFCESNIRCKSTTKNTITYEQYLSLSNSQSVLQTSIDSLKDSLKTIDKTLKQLHDKTSGLNHVSKPTIPITIMSSDLLLQELDKHDANALKHDLSHDQDIMNKFYEGLDHILHLQNEQLAYKNELALLENNDEYKYNPLCECCCQRPWVKRIKELNGILTQLQKDIDVCNHNLFDNTTYDYLQLYIKCDETSQLVDKLDLYRQWYDYIVLKEHLDRISVLLNEKDVLQSRLSNGQNKYDNNQEILNAFNVKSFELYDQYMQSHAYNTYQEWKITYDDLESRSLCLSQSINILPRIHKLNALKDKYDAWSISASYNFINLEKDLKMYHQRQEYIRNKELQPKLKRKLEITDQIRSIEMSIQQLQKSLIEQNTIACIRNKNKETYSKLSGALSDITETINLFDLIVDKFKDYRKDLYETKILRNLTSKANKYIKSLCHADTKMFEIDFLLTELKDVLHINWLVKNTENTQVISVKQASGFQQFAISLALRMSLYSNTVCRQLFIDEGFTACDKQNLSIIPGFLRTLLLSFNTVVMVSHIDIIQDSIDNIAYITYDINKNSSRIQYGTST